MRLKADQECFLCSYCASIDVPETNAEGIRVFDEPADGLACPVCSTALLQASANGHRLAYCNQCHGMLISMEVFPAVIQDLKSRRSALAYDARPFDPEIWAGG